MRQARHGMTTVLLGMGVAALALLVSACANYSDPGGSGGAGATPSEPEPSPSATDEPSGAPSGSAGPLPQFADVELAAGVSGRGLPKGVEGTMESPAGVGWSPEEGLLFVVTYGSSSCPTLAEADATSDGDTVTVAMVPPPANAICTMDYAPTTTVVASPDGTDTGAPVMVTLGNLGTVEVQPRAADAEVGPMAWVETS